MIHYTKILRVYKVNKTVLPVFSAAKCGEFSPKWGFLTVPKGGFLTVLFSKISENVGIFKNFGPSGEFHPKTFGSTAVGRGLNCGALAPEWRFWHSLWRRKNFGACRKILTCPFFLDVHYLFHLIFNHFLVCPSSDGTCHGSSLWKGILEFLFI